MQLNRNEIKTISMFNIDWIEFLSSNKAVYFSNERTEASYEHCKCCLSLMKFKKNDATSATY